MIRASRILVPVNGNPTDDEAVALACEIGRRGKAAVYAIYVIEVKRTLPLDVDLPPEAAKGDTVLGGTEADLSAAAGEISGGIRLGNHRQIAVSGVEGER